MDPVKELRKVNVYDFTLVSLVIIAVIGLLFETAAPLLEVVAVPIFAGGFDYLCYRFLNKREALPKSAVITGLLIAMVISPGNILGALAAALLAIASKHLILFKKKSIFNPAALGLVLSAILLHTTDSWWGATVSLSIPLTFLMVILSLLVSWKIGKLPLTLSFMAATAVLTAAYFGIPATLSVQGLLSLLGFMFFGGMMLTEPKTSAFTRTAMIAEGVLVVIVSFSLSAVAPAIASSVDALLLTLLGMNVIAPLLSAKLK